MSLEFSRQLSTVFVNCAMRDMDGPQPTELTLRNCTYTVMPPELRHDEAHRRRDLNTLFPEWQQRVQRR